MRPGSASRQFAWRSLELEGVVEEGVDLRFSAAAASDAPAASGTKLSGAMICAWRPGQGGGATDRIALQSGRRDSNP